MWKWLGDIAGSIGSWFLNNMGERNAQEREHQQNMQMAEYQYGKDLQMWKLQNEYNLPINQVQRMKDAGMNPALMYQGNPQNVASEMPKYAAPRSNFNYHPLEKLNVMSAYQEVRMKDAQADLVETEVKLRNDKLANQWMENEITRLKGKEWKYKTDLQDWRSSEIPYRGMSYDQALMYDQLKKNEDEDIRRYYDNMYAWKRLDDQEQELVRKKLLNQWLKMGLTPGDSMIWRIIGRGASKFQGKKWKDLGEDNRGYPLGWQRYASPDPYR